MKWTPEQLDTLTRCYPLVPTKDLAEMLGKTEKQALIAANALKVKLTTAQTIIQLDKIEAKKCSTCGEFKLLEDFSANRSTKTNLDSQCKKCR